MELLQELTNQGPHHERLYTLVLEEDELSWQQIIYELVREQRMDPWDVDISQLTGKFLQIIRKLSELDFRVSGKMVLASSMLLKLKSERLLDEDLGALDSLIASTEESEDDFDMFGMSWDDTDVLIEEPVEQKRPKIYPRTPQPRQRKVSVYDLVTALEQALEVSVRREKRALDSVEVEVRAPEKKIDVSDMMNGLLERISTHFTKKQQLQFSELLPTQERQDKVMTFIPLLHLINERRIDMHQKIPFEEILITLLDTTPVQYQEQVV